MHINLSQRTQMILGVTMIAQWQQLEFMVGELNHWMLLLNIKWAPQSTMLIHDLVLLNIYKDETTFCSFQVTAYIYSNVFLADNTFVLVCKTIYWLQNSNKSFAWFEGLQKLRRSCLINWSNENQTAEFFRLVHPNLLVFYNGKLNRHCAGIHLALSW